VPYSILLIYSFSINAFSAFSTDSLGAVCHF